MRCISEIPVERQEAARKWFKIIDGLEKSKSTKSNYFKTHQINSSSFYRWLHYLNGETNKLYKRKTGTKNIKIKNKQPSFIAVTVKKEPTVVTNDVGSSGLELILANSFTLRINKAFDSVSLVKVVTALRSLC